MTRIARVPFLLAWPPGRYAAQVLLPNRIFVRRGVPLTVQLIAHELAHVDQISRLGLVRYWLAYLWLLLRFGYERHPMEGEAHEYARSAAGLARAERLLVGQQV